MRFRVYRNLGYRGVRWSIYSEDLQRVVAHAESVTLADVEFVVNPSALRYMREVLHKRWVVGWAVGDVVSTVNLIPAGRDLQKGQAAFEYLCAQSGDQRTEGIMVRFDPWRMDSFQTDAGPLCRAASLTLRTDGKAVI